MHLSLHVHSLTHSVIKFLDLYPHSAGIITFIVVFLEALAVVGVVVPGTIFMTAIGALIGSDVIPAGSTFLFAMAGAITGDVVSYILGICYQNRFSRTWLFKKYPWLFEKSELFFKKHGGKSVFIGRFFGGPIRAMVPMVAGILKMSPGKFLLAALPSASIWAVTYMLPGVVLGALSLELPPKMATQFILVVLGLLVVFWCVVWLMHHFAKRITQWIDGYIMRFWIFMQQHKTLCWVTKLLADPREPENHRQLSLLFLAGIFTVLFFVVFWNIASHGIFTIFDNAIYNLLLSWRTPFLDHIMVAVTLLGDVKVLLGASVLFLAWLIYKRYWYVAIHWCVLILLSGGAIFVLKNIIFLPRPGGILNAHYTSSFPSGHAALSLAFMGFWAVVVARELPSERRMLPYVGSSILVALIAFSRLYLGAHWLTDVFASLLLATALVLALTISYRRRHTNHFSLRSFIACSLWSLFLVWAGYALCSYSKSFDDYSIKWQVKTISFQNWQSEIGTSIPLYRLNRMGRPIQAFNVEWLGKLSDIEDILLKLGWTKHSTEVNLPDIVLKLANHSAKSHLPLLPQLYHNRPLALLMTKETKRSDTALVLQLWQSDIKVQETDLPLWLGVIDYHYADLESFKLHTLLRYVRQPPKFRGAAATLKGRLDGFKWQKVIYPLERQPEEMRYLQWDGEIFLVQPNLETRN